MTFCSKRCFTPTIFRFETADGHGSGILRLTPDANDGTLKAWTVTPTPTLPVATSARTYTPACLITSRTAASLWTGRLSIITTSGRASFVNCRRSSWGSVRHSRVS
jgi:hypothetical protein